MTLAVVLAGLVPPRSRPVLLVERRQKCRSGARGPRSRILGDVTVSWGFRQVQGTRAGQGMGVKIRLSPKWPWRWVRWLALPIPGASCWSRGPWRGRSANRDRCAPG